MQIVSTPPPRFCHIGAKMSVLWPLKYAKIRFRSGLCPGSRWESSRRSPDLLVRWRGDTPPHTPSHSARIHLRRSPCVPPEVQPDLRLCSRMRQTDGQMDLYERTDFTIANAVLHYVALPINNEKCCNIADRQSCSFLF